MTTSVGRKYRAPLRCRSCFAPLKAPLPAASGHLGAVSRRTVGRSQSATATRQPSTSLAARRSRSAGTRRYRTGVRQRQSLHSGVVGRWPVLYAGGHLRRTILRCAAGRAAGRGVFMVFDPRLQIHHGPETPRRRCDSPSAPPTLLALIGSRWPAPATGAVGANRRLIAVKRRAILPGLATTAMLSASARSGGRASRSRFHRSLRHATSTSDAEPDRSLEGARATRPGARRHPWVKNYQSRS